MLRGPDVQWLTDIGGGAVVEAVLKSGADDLLRSHPAFFRLVSGRPAFELDKAIIVIRFR
jgi:hypothetical protein